MATQGKEEEHQHPGDNQQATNQAADVGWMEAIQQQYRRIKENAETYPYVWGSYIVVYGGLGFWFAYRWRKLRRTEDRVRVLQERLHKLVEAEESASSKFAESSTAGEKAPPSDKSKI